jgi:hypothetical protein
LAHQRVQRRPAGSQCGASASGSPSSSLGSLLPGRDSRDTSEGRGTAGSHLRLSGFQSFGPASSRLRPLAQIGGAARVQSAGAGGGPRRMTGVSSARKAAGSSLGEHTATAVKADTLDEFLKGWQKTDVARWLTVVLRDAGVVEARKGPPLKLRIASPQVSSGSMGGGRPGARRVLSSAIRRRQDTRGRRCQGRRIPTLLCHPHTSSGMWSPK